MDIIDRWVAKERGLKKYYTGKECKWGHLTTRSVCRGACDDCARLERKKHRHTRKYRDQRLALHYKYYKEKPEKIRLTNVKTRCRRKGIEFAISESDVCCPDVCPVFGLPLRKATKGFDVWSPAIDRIDNDRGYVRGNVQVISSQANRLKSDATQEEIFLVALRAFGPDSREGFTKLLVKYGIPDACMDRY